MTPARDVPDGSERHNTVEPLYGATEREPFEEIYASLLAADGRVYVVGRKGATAVLAHGRTLKALATGRLEDRFDASPVAIGDPLLLRGHRFLYGIEARRPEGQVKASQP